MISFVEVVVATVVVALVPGVVGNVIQFALSFLVAGGVARYCVTHQIGAARRRDLPAISYDKEWVKMLEQVP